MEVGLSIMTRLIDPVLMDSKGGQVTDSQLFAFSGGQGPTALVPKNGKDSICLVGQSGRLDAASCVASQPSTNEVCETHLSSVLIGKQLSNTEKSLDFHIWLD